MSIPNIATPLPKKAKEHDGKKIGKKSKCNQLGAQTGMCPVAKQPGVLEGKHAWKTKLTRNQHKQESSEQYQGHWLDIQLVPIYFQTWDSQATLQGIESTHGEHTKLRCPQLYTQAKINQLLER